MNLISYPVVPRLNAVNLPISSQKVSRVSLPLDRSQIQNLSIAASALVSEHIRNSLRQRTFTPFPTMRSPLLILSLPPKRPSPPLSCQVLSTLGAPLFSSALQPFFQVFGNSLNYHFNFLSLLFAKLYADGSQLRIFDICSDLAPLSLQRSISPTVVRHVS